MRNKTKQDYRVKLLRKYIKRGDLRVSTVAGFIGVSVITVYNWLDGKSSVSPLASAGLDRFLADYATGGRGRIVAEDIAAFLVGRPGGSPGGRK